MANLKNMGDSVAAQFQGLSGVHPGLWPFVPRLLCALAVGVLVVGLGWYFFWDSQIDELGRGQQDEQKLRAEYTTKTQLAINLDGLRKQKEQVDEYVRGLEKQLPSKAEMDALLSDINQAGLGRGLQFELFKPGQVVVKGYYAELPINIKLTGVYHDIGAFAADIAHLPRIVTLNNLAITANKDGGLMLDAIAKTFRYLDQEEIDAQAASEKKKKGGKK